MFPNDRRYTKEHEWVKVAGGAATVGITDFAQRELGDIVYVELPEIGRAVVLSEVLGTIESVKAVSELYCPVSGEVVEVNASLSTEPELVNRDPQGAWMIALALADAAELDGLLDSAQYDALVK